MDEFATALRACLNDESVSHDGEFFTIPEGIMRPKPAGDLPLMAGVWSEAGLRRTAEHFDLWNPGGPATSLDDALVALDRINGMRADCKKPVGMVYRTATEAPSGALLGVEGVLDVVARAREQDIAGVIIETNFDRSVTSPDVWLELLERLAPAAAQ
jgi:alkanesulfonate monooxygenase SsuD/methylene tetrahydromethanopterin reductase-like flavin-dependent oxidoreductase (luciferase family)